MTRQPNILFFFPDQHRGDWMPFNTDLPLRMPNIERLMAEGTTFTRAYTPSPLCAPARACLASGREYATCRVPSNHDDYPLDLPTYYAALRDAGYEVAGVGKFDLHKDTRDPSSMDWHLDGSRLLEEWGFTAGIDNEGKFDGSSSYRQSGGQPKGPYMSALARAGVADAYVAEHANCGAHKSAYVSCIPEELYCDNWLSDNGLRIIREVPVGKPWHMVVNFTGPHGPMDVTQRMHDAWVDVEFPPPHSNHQDGWTAADHQRNRQHYAAMIENIDRQIGRFLDLVDKRGELEHTLIVFASDHGEMLGDHSRWGKGTWREASANIPFVIAGPGLRQGAVCNDPVVLHDLTATFIDAADADMLPDIESHSLLPVCRGEAPSPRNHVNLGLGNWRAVTDGKWKLVVEGDDDPQLFNLEEDPWEDHDVAASCPDKVTELKQLL